MDNSNYIRLYLLKDSGKFSTNPMHSDIFHNAVLMFPLVGTLVKYDKNRRFQPYLAQSWNHSADFRNWSFEFRKNLVDESGLEISPANYINGLLPILKQFPKNVEIPIFSDLVKWNEFTNGKVNNPGINTVGTHGLEFHFKIKKTDGVLDFLSLPYFGFHNPKQFVKSWDSTKIISSAAFKLKEYGEQRVLLEARDNWFTQTPKHLEIILHKDMDPKLAEEKNSVIYKDFASGESVFESHRVMKGNPMVLNALIISDLKNNQFKSTDNRRKFIDDLRKAQEQVNVESINMTVSPFFHPVRSSDLKSLKMSDKSPTQNEISVTFSNAFSKKERSYIDQVFDRLKNVGYRFNFETDERKDPKKTMKIMENNWFDIRVIRVVVGMDITNWNNRMMFCSTLGLRLRDPSGRICELTKRYELEEGKMTLDDYKEEFNKYINEDASVVPLFSSRFTWSYYEPLIDKYYSAIQLFPEFEAFDEVKN